MDLESCVYIASLEIRGGFLETAITASGVIDEIFFSIKTSAQAISGRFPEIAHLPFGFWAGYHHCHGR